MDSGGGADGVASSLFLPLQHLDPISAPGKSYNTKWNITRQILFILTDE